jgi:hypothetical protein
MNVRIASDAAFVFVPFRNCNHHFSFHSISILKAPAAFAFLLSTRANR